MQAVVKGKLSGKDIALIGLLSASITAGKFALAFVPNVEVVTLLFILYTIAFGPRRILFTSVVFTTTEILIYGFHTWLLAYYFVWPTLILLSSIMKNRINSEYGYAALAGFFGLTFGFYFALVEALFYGYLYGLTYWIRGIPFDIIHGVSNYIIVLFLFKPLRRALERQLKQ